LTSTPLKAEEVKAVYEQCGGDLNKIAERLGVAIPDFQQFAPATPPPARRRKPPADIGKEKLRKFIVSVRHVENSVWPSDDTSKIELARARYEAGTYEMCQGRDRDWFVLYSIPRKERTGARKFFQTEGY
jgi:hypothetical protein